MKIETAIERLNLMIKQCLCYEEALLDDDNEDMREELHDTEVELETLRMAKRALEEKSRWIPCSERMPEMHEENDCGVKIKVSEPVLFCEKTGLHACVHIGTLREAFEERWWLTREWKTYKDVTAWMPLPEAYKEED